VDENSPRWWIRGCPGVGKSTTLFAVLNSPVFASKGFIWVHATDSGYVVVVKTKSGDCFHGMFKPKDWEKVEALLFEDDTIDVECTVLDGVDQLNMRQWFARSCELSKKSRGQKKVIACTSYQVLNYNTEDMKMMGYFRIYNVDSWKFEEYSDGFERRVLSKLAKDKEELIEKYYYAGGNIRLMWEPTVIVKEIIDTKMKTVGNFESLLRRQIGESSSSAVNTLTQSFDDECIPLSKYVMDCLSKRVGLAFVEQASAILLDNPSWQGWVFELRMMVLLQQQQLSLSFIAMNDTVVSWTAAHPQIIDIDASDHTRLPKNIPNACWLKPIKYNQGCFDLLFYHYSGKVDYFQFTKAKDPHEYKLQYIAKILPALVNSSVNTNSVNLFVVIPKENQFTFSVTSGNLQDSSLIEAFDHRWTNIPSQVCPKRSSKDQAVTYPPFPPLQIVYFDRQH
jgi:hypothetical protein